MRRVIRVHTVFNHNAGTDTRIEPMHWQAKRVQDQDQDTAFAEAFASAFSAWTSGFRSGHSRATGHNLATLTS